MIYLNEERSVVWLLNSLETHDVEQAIHMKGSIPVSYHQSQFFQVQA